MAFLNPSKEESRDASISVVIWSIIYSIIVLTIPAGMYDTTFGVHNYLIRGILIGGFFMSLLAGVGIVHITQKYIIRLYHWKLPIENDFLRRFVKSSIFIIGFFTIGLILCFILFLVGTIWESKSDKDINPNDPNNVNGFNHHIKKAYFDKDGYIRND
jgi:hypothetical protein